MNWDKRGTCKFCAGSLLVQTRWARDENGTRVFHTRELCSACGALCINGVWQTPLFELPKDTQPASGDS